MLTDKRCVHVICLPSGLGHLPRKETTIFLSSAQGDKEGSMCPSKIRISNLPFKNIWPFWLMQKPCLFKRASLTCLTEGLRFGLRASGTFWSVSERCSVHTFALSCHVYCPLLCLLVLRRLSSALNLSRVMFWMSVRDQRTNLEAHLNEAALSLAADALEVMVLWRMRMRWHHRPMRRWSCRIFRSLCARIGPRWRRQGLR